MEVRLSYGISLYLVEMVILTLRAIYANECRLCKPGYYASRLCSETHDTVCKPCSTGTFSARPNVFRQCAPCSNCNLGEFVFEGCSKSRDTVCVPSSSFESNLSPAFVRDCCTQHQYRQIEHNIDNSYDVIDSDRHKRNDDAFSGASNDNTNTYIVDDGSGEIIKNDLTNATSTEEGSGFISEVDDIYDSNATSAIPILLPEEGNEKNENVGEITTLAVATTTVKTERIDDGNKGIILKNNNMNEDNHDVIVNTQVQSTTATTTIITTMDKSGLTLHVSRPDFSEEEQDDVQNEENQRYQYAGPHTTERQKGAGIGVVVTVWLVAAVTFFVLGFIVSKCWSGRQERTFNVEEAERQNRKNQITFYTIEYRDDENIEPKNCYKISTTVDGSTSEMLSGNDIEMVDTSDSVNSKPIQSEIAAPVTNAALAPPFEEKASGVSQPPRPISETGYNDEDVGGDASDVLLSRPRAVSETTDECSSTSSKTSHLNPSNDRDIKDDREIDNETTPILTQISESHAR